VVEVVSPPGAVVTVVSVGGRVVVEAMVVEVVVVVEGSVLEAVEVVVVVESVAPGDGVDGVGVVGAGVVERGWVGSGNRSPKVTGGHIRAARASGVGATTATRAPTRMSATTRAAPSLPFIVSRLPTGPEVGNLAVLRYVGKP
jgi:hypothetical protein